jgi:hypothetical protein
MLKENQYNNVEENDSNISYNSLEISSIDLNNETYQKNETQTNEDLNSSFDLKTELSGQLKIESEENFKNFFSPIKDRQRSQTYISFNYKPEDVPKLKPKKINEKVSPMKLCIKSFGNNNFNERFTNEILFEYQNNLIECLSCPDENDDSFDLNDTLDCTNEENSYVNELRKEMKVVKNNIDDCKLNEYENILSVNKILEKNKQEKNNKKNKKFDWKKLIHEQEELNWKFLVSNEFNSNNLIYERTHSCIITPNFKNKKNMKNSNISILGILESAAKESKKRRYTAKI